MNISSKEQESIYAAFKLRMLLYRLEIVTMKVSGDVNWLQFRLKHRVNEKTSR